MTENEISYEIRGAIFSVHNYFGPGLFESVYKAALMKELAARGLRVMCEVPIPVFYHEEKLDEIGFKIDIMVEGKVIIEIKSIENLLPVHHKQIITYLKLTEIKLGILVNFNCVDIANNIFRKVNGL